MSSGATIAQLEQVSICYGAGADILRAVDLTVLAGSFRFLVAPAGAGKTSLLRVLRLAHAPTGGRLRLFGRETTRLDRDERARLRQRIGIVFQELRLLDHLSAYDNVALRLRLAGAEEEQISAQVSPLLRWLGLGEVLERRPPELAAADRQLVAVARAAVGSPGLLLADEPLASLDPGQAERVMRLLMALQREGTAVLLATRAEELARRYGFAVLRLASGRLTGGASHHLPLTA